MTSTPYDLPPSDQLSELAFMALMRCGVEPGALNGDSSARSSITGTRIVSFSSATEVDSAISRAQQVFLTWRSTPAPIRGDLVKQYGKLLEENIDSLALLITLEIGKVLSEARAEIREVIEMCDLALGLSRRLEGRTIPSGRPKFRLMETFQPLGPVAFVTPFSFPAAVWGWGALTALVCGNPIVWKPSEHAPLTALACASLLDRAALETDAPRDLCQVLNGGAVVSRLLAQDNRVALINISGRTSTGRELAPLVAARLGRALLHLSGNNASIITPSADLTAAMHGVVTAATSAAGQRCTSMRRLFIHESRTTEVLNALDSGYNAQVLGNPLSPYSTVGPLLNQASYETMNAALEEAKQQGGSLILGGRRIYEELAPDAFYVQPAIVQMPLQSSVMHRETIAPLLYIVEYTDIQEAIRLNNDVPQGFTSSIYTRCQSEAELFLSAEGSDCGVVNINLHTSGAEVSAAFGGEKDTGGGRQCGSDVWKSYTRRITTAVS